jgi:hypothetical protein
MRRRRALWLAPTLVAVIAVLAVAGVAVARGVVADSGVLNQTVTQDPVGDSASADLSSLTITSYADQTVSFAVAFANRDLLHPGETVQLFIDLNDDGTADLNLSIWATGEPSYLAHWGGSDWVDVRELSELSEYKGGFSVRLHNSDLTGAAQMPISPSFGAVVGAWTTDPSTGNPRTKPDDLLPDAGVWIQHQMTAPQTTTAQTSTNPARRTPPVAPPKLALSCSAGRVLRAIVIPGSAAIHSVNFYADGTLKRKVGKSPWVALVQSKTLHQPVLIKAVVTADSKSQTLLGMHSC